MAPARPITDEELLQIPKDGSKYEVVDGELVAMSPAGFRHEEIVAELIRRLGNFVHEHQLGRVLAPDALYTLPNGNRRGPDASFVSAERRAAVPADVAFPELVPDLAVEVLSPFDSPRQVLGKVGDYLQSGVRLVWVIDPKARKAVIHRSLNTVREIEEAGSLDGEDVLPGLRCALSDLLA
jgi:Uma2 family endonuclease